MVIKNHTYVIAQLSLIMLWLVGMLGVQPAQAETINAGWAQRIGESDFDYGVALDLDAVGNVYATGFVGQTPSIFISKLNNSGDFLWTKVIGGSSGARTHALKVSDEGDVYVTGAYHGTIDFDPGVGVSNLTSAGIGDTFLSKFDSNGNFLWARSIGGTSADSGNSLVLDPAGYLYLTGYYSDTVDFDPGVGIDHLTSAGGTDIFLSKFDSNGNFIWAKGMGGVSEDSGYGLTSDADGNPLIVGNFSETVDFDPGAGTQSLTSLGEADIFIGKFDTNGNFVWAVPIGGSGHDNAVEVAVDGWGNIYAVGASSGSNYDVFLGKLESNGNFLWARTIGGESSDFGYGIAIDAGGNVYFTGDFSGTVDFDPSAEIQTLTSAGWGDIFVNKLDIDGNLVWAKRLGGPGGDLPDGFVLDDRGNVYLTGSFSETADFDPGAGTRNLTSAGSGDVFITKLSVEETIAQTSFLVTNTNDSGAGSLRQAVLQPGAGNTITFAASLAGQTIHLASELVVSQDLTIDASALTSPVVLSGGGTSRIMQITGIAQVTVDGLTFTQGATPGSGGAIFMNMNSGLTLKNSTFSLNRAGAGGAIFTQGNNFIHIENSTFHENHSDSTGGAISMSGNSALTITGSTFFANHATGDGGAIWAGNLTLEGTTLAYNSAEGDGGALHTVHLMLKSTMINDNQAGFEGGAIAFVGNSASTMINSTVYRNQAADSGGGFFFQGNTSLEIYNSTIAHNTAVSGHEIAASGTNNISAANTIFLCGVDGDECYNLPLASTLNTPNTILGSGSLRDYGLAEPAANGGPTRTMALLPDSPLIDAGNDAVCANAPGADVDQRGVARPQGLHCDIGAYERQTRIRFVKQDAIGTKEGSSWINAHTDLQAALLAASPDEEIWVAAGTYKPTADTNRSISFTLKNAVAVYGGFAGTETSLSQRDYETNLTILSGDIGVQGNHTDNSYHVVVGSDTNNSAILDGFTIMHGTATDTLGPSADNAGGGMFVRNGSPSVLNVIFTENKAVFGGGMLNAGDFGMPESGSHPVLRNVLFEDNVAIEGGGMRNEHYSRPTLTDVTFDGNLVTRLGGGLENTGYSHAVLTNVTFTNNVAADATGRGIGGGMANILSNPQLTNVTFANNSSQWGGGMANGLSSPALTHVTFTGNSATQNGGGIANEENSDPILTNVTFNSNSAAMYGGAIYNTATLIVNDSVFNGNMISGSEAKRGGAIANDGGTLIVENSTFSANSAVINPYFVMAGEGGAIYSHGALSITGSTFTENQASRGGAVSCETGTLTVTNSTFDSNAAMSESGGDGGAIYDSCESTIRGSTFAANRAAHHGGALLTDHDASSIQLINNTLYGNIAATGGGVANYGALVITNSTFSHNHSPNAGAIRNGLGGTLSLRNSILANSIEGVDCIKSDSTPAIESINNLVETTPAGLESCGTPAVAHDPLLGPLQNNGGVTQTMALGAGSPAIDAASDANCPATDQRGVTRPQGARCDIGAYEYQATTIAPTILSITRANPSPTNASSIGFTVTFSEPVTGVVANDFTLTSSGTIAGAAIQNVSGSGSAYIVTVNTGSGNGTLRLDVPAAVTINDTDSNLLGDLPFTGGEVYSVTKSATFSDVENTYWAWSYIERLYRAGITSGCSTNAPAFCPEGTVTRAQMAVFLERGMNGALYTPPAVGNTTGFGDVPTGYWAAAWIKQLGADGITSGCGNGMYCPEAPVTRAQMAVFLLKAKHGKTYAPPPIGSSSGFHDVTLDHWAAAWIKQLAAEGITGGCGSGNYCPNAPVTRAQMAVFLVKTFSLP